MNKRRVNDSVRRDAVSRKDERRFMVFIKSDPHFSQYYEDVAAEVTKLGAV